MERVIFAASGLSALLFLALSLWLGQQGRSGPPRQDLTLAGGVPATLYLPGAGSDGAAFLDPPPPARRPPAVAMMHGFSSDRRSLGTLARHLAAAGYAVLSFDARGHGGNRNPYADARARPDGFHDEFAAAVDFLRATRLVDGERIAVAGHSMGAGAALDYATRDSGLDAVVCISGGFSLAGPFRPPNALFLYAEAEPEPIRARAELLAARIAGADALRAGRTYGRLSEGTGVRIQVVADAGHGSIVWERAAASEVVAWLDRAFGIDRPAPELAPDPRGAAVRAAGVALLLLLPGIGLALGRLLPRGPATPGRDGGRGHLALALALLGALPLLALGAVGPLLPLEVGDGFACHLLLSGAGLLAWLALRGRLAAALVGQLAPATFLAAGLATLGFAALLQPLSVIFHAMSLTPERSVAFALAALALAPFALAFELLLRVGGPLAAASRSLLGRGIVLAALASGGAAVSGWIALALLPLVGMVFLYVEALAFPLYAVSRNRVAIALIEAAWLGYAMAAILPIRL